MLSFMEGIGLLLSNSIALPLQQHQANLDSNSINSNSNLENSTNYQTSYDTSLLSSGTNAGWASSKPFAINSGGGNGTLLSYRENGFIMASGSNKYGGLGNRTDNTNATTGYDVGEAFAVYKEGDPQQPFYNAMDYVFALNSAIIDSTGKLYTAGFGSYGALGNGTSSGFLGDYGSGSYQYSFQQVLTAKDVSDENKANALPDNYQAVAVSAAYAGSLVLLNDGTLYAAGYQYGLGLGTSSYQTHFTRLDGRATGLPAATSSNKIKDFSYSSNSTWVLYENGELYMTSASSATPGDYTLVASDIKFFDLDRGRVYAVNTSNQILSCTYSSSALTTLVANPNGTVTQVRGSNNGGWGYLNSNNELYLSNSSSTTAPGASNATPEGTTFYKMDNVAFFDLGSASSSTMVYGVMYTNGDITVWGDNTFGQQGNGTVGNTGNTTTTPEAGAKPDIEIAPEDIPNVGEDELKDPEDFEFEDEDKLPIIPISFIPPASSFVQFLIVNIYNN